MESPKDSLPSERFKKNVLYLHEIICDMYDEARANNIIGMKSTALMKSAVVLINRMDSEKMINNFIKKSNIYWDKIYNKDIEYFKEIGLSLFKDFEENGIEKFKKMGEEEMGEKIQEDSLLSKIGDGEVKEFHKVISGSFTCVDEDDGTSEEVDIFDDERKEDVWKIMHALVKVSLVYVHEKRCRVNGKYTVDFFNDIKVKSGAEKWGIKSILSSLENEKSSLDLSGLQPPPYENVVSEKS